MVQAGLLYAGMGKEVAGVLTKLGTYRGALPQGAPTSPSLLNLALFEFDLELQSIASSHNAVYTRYMDDLAFSSQSELDLLAREVLIRIRSFGYRVHPTKRHVYRPGDVKTLTKIVLADDLRPNSGFLTRLEQDLAAARRTRDPKLCNKIEGKIGWIRSLDASLSRKYDRQFKALKAAL
jgi:RNA-directed DNA polymerase